LVSEKYLGGISNPLADSFDNKAGQEIYSHPSTH
jgi:hypothetical protein